MSRTYQDIVVELQKLYKEANPVFEAKERFIESFEKIKSEYQNLLSDLDEFEKVWNENSESKEEYLEKIGKIKSKFKVLLEGLEGSEKDCKSVEESDMYLERINALKEELKEYELKNGLFNPIEDLQKLKGSRLRMIALIKENSDGSREEARVYGNIEVDENGHLKFLSYK